MLLTEQDRNEIYRELLLETVKKSRIINSIKNRVVNLIYYEGDSVNKPGYRRIEIFTFGVSKAGNPVIRAWQRGGVSDTPNGKPNDPLSRIPGWRMFRLDKIKSFANTIGRFEPNKPKYNPEDKDMVTIYDTVENYL